MNKRFTRAPVLAGAVLTVVSLLAAPAGAFEPQRTRSGVPPAGKAATPLEARSVNHVEGARTDVPSWSFDLTDGRDATALSTDVIAVRYAGAAEWTNLLELRYRGEGTLEVDLLRPRGEVVAGAARVELAPATDWTTVEVAVAPAIYQGVSVRIIARPGRAPAEVSELGAYWFEEELTRDAAEVADEWCEDYPGSNNDLSSPNETAQRFSDYLRDHGWTWRFDYGNSAAWETDFKRHDLGGHNNAYVDATDAFIYCGHGSNDRLSLANSTHDDSSVDEADIDGAWGDTDLEWAFFHCCLNMQSTDWHHALNGAHTISGAINVINGSTNWGKTIARKLIDNGIFDSSWSIYSSWWHSNDSNQPAGNRFRLLAEDQSHYNERIWGQGTVQPDSPDGNHWTVSHTVSKAAGGLAVFDPASVQRASEPVLWSPPAGLADPDQPGLVVRVHPEVLQKRLPEVASIMDVLPSGMNDQTTVEMFSRLCEVLGLECDDVAVGREDGEGYAAAAGLANLSGDIASGGWQFTNQELHLVPERAPDMELEPEQAAQRAFEQMQQLDLIDQNAFLAGVNVMEAVEFDSTGNVLQSFPFMYDVVVGRRTGGTDIQYPVVGPGGRTHVAVGLDGQVQALSQVSRQLQQRQVVDVIALATVFDQLAAFGFPVVQAAPEFIAEEIEVRDANLGYFEHGISSQQTAVGPVYYLDVDLIGPDPRDGGPRVTVPGRLYVAADAVPVRGQILAPEDGAVVEVGEAISFRSGATDGSPPYQFQWFADSIGLISNQQNFTTDQLQPAVRESGMPSPLTIELRVTDSIGNSTTDQIQIVFTGVVGVDDPPPAFELADAFPNPFNPRTTIAFATPTAGQATLRILDVRGRLVRTLLDEAVTAGHHARIWTGTDQAGRPVASGIYLYRIEFRGADGAFHEESRQMTLIR